MKLNGKLLAAGLIAAAVSGVSILVNQDTDNRTVPVAGQEIAALRRSNVKIYETDKPGVRQARVYARDVHYRDNETGKLEDYDFSERNVDETMKDNPRRKHDTYVKIGNHGVGWMKGKKHDYRFTHESGYHVAYTFLNDTAGIVIDTEYQRTGVKQTYTLTDSIWTGRLRWILDTDAHYTLDGGQVTFTDSTGAFLFRTTTPVAWDAKGAVVDVAVTVEGDTLSYAVDVEGAVFPVVVDPSTQVESYGDDGRAVSSDATYLTARNSTTGSVNTNYYGYVGQSSAADYTIYRAFLNFPSPDQNIATVDAESLYIMVSLDNSNTDFTFLPIQGTFSGAPAEGWFNDFHGWESSGTYTADTMSNFFDTSVGSWSNNTWKNVPFHSFGRDSTRAVWARGDTLRLMLLSTRDTNPVEPTGLEYIVFYNSENAGKEPYLSITYTTATPTGFTMTAASADSIDCVWDNTITGEDSTRIRDAVSGDYIGAVAGTDTTFSIGGLIPNTIYAWEPVVVGGTADGQVGAADSTCTDAAAVTVAPSLFTAGGNVFDQSGNGNHGTNNGSRYSTDTGDGSVGAAEFDGVNDYVDCGNNASLNPTTAITMEAWVKFNTLSSIRTIASTFEAGGYGLSFNEDTYPNKIVFLVRVGGSYRYGVSNDTPNISKWYHLVGTYDGTIVKLYINGLLQTFVTNISGVIQNSIHTFQIASNPPGSNFFPGLIDDVRIYSRALSEATIDSIYTGETVSDEGLVLHLDFDLLTTEMIAVIDTTGTGNPSDTDYAIRFIDSTPDTNWVCASGDTLRVSLGVEDEWGWATYDEWGAADGVTVTGLTPGHQYSVAILGRRRDF